MRAVAVVAALCAYGSTVAAQGVPHLYVSAGGAAAWRDRPVSPPQSLSDNGPYRALTPAVTIAAGVQLSRLVAVEGSVQVQRGQSAPWKFSYQFGGGITEERATHKDIPIVGSLRVTPRLGRRIGIDPVAGAGYTWHKAESFTTARCGSPNFPTPCTPVSPPEISDSLGTFEFLIAAGLDFPVQVSSRVSLAPSLRVLHVVRRQYLTGYVHRGPANGSHEMLTIGVSATWRRR